MKSTSALTPAAIICRAASSLFRAASKTTGASEAISILSAVCAHRTSSSKLFKPRARKIFAANSRSPRRRSYSRSTERKARMETKYAPPASPKICPHPPAFSICRPLRPVTEEPVPAFTAIPSRSRRHAAIPESRSLPATILALGQTARASFSKTSTIFLRHAAGEKNSNPIYFTRQNAENFRDLIQRRQAQVRRRQFSRLYDCAIGHQRPCRLRSSTLDPENFFVIHFVCSGGL